MFIRVMISTLLTLSDSFLFCIPKANIFIYLLYLLCSMEGYPGYRATSRVKIVEEAGRAYLVVRRKKAKTIITSG
jgi:hypothetical protein